MGRVQKNEALLAIAATCFARGEISIEKLSEVAMRYAAAKWHNRKARSKTVDATLEKSETWPAKEKE